MFFNRSLRLENQTLKQDLHTLTQVRESLDNDMLRISLNSSGQVISVNAKFCSELDVSESNVIHKHITELVPEAARNTEHYRLMKTAIAEGKHWHGALQIVKKDGKEAWLRTIIQPIKDIDNKLMFFYIYASELTRTIESSREQEDMLNALHRSTAVIEFTPTGEILKANDNFLKTMGYSIQEIVGKHHRMFCESEEANSQEYKNFWKRLGSGEYASERFKRIDSHGQVVWLKPHTTQSTTTEVTSIRL